MFTVVLPADGWSLSWNAIAALATTFAVLVALAVPFIMDWRSRRAIAEEKRANNIEICLSVDLAIRYFLEAQRLTKDNPVLLPHLARCEWIASEATDIKNGLSTLIRLPGVTGSVIKAGLTAQRIVSSVERALCDPYGRDEADWDRRRNELALAKVVADRAADWMVSARSIYRLPSSLSLEAANPMPDRSATEFRVDPSVPAFLE